MDIFCGFLRYNAGFEFPLNTSSRTNDNSTAYQKTVLDSGLRVVSESIPYVRSVSIGVWANVGSRDETEAQNGISHFLEHMVFKGTRNRNVREIAQSIESLGGFLNAFTTKEQTCFYARVLDEHLPQAVDVLFDLVQNATFNREEMEKEKTVVIEELKNTEDDPEDLIHEHFEREIFPNHSLGYPIIGTEKNLRAFTRQDLFDRVESHYRPGRMVLAAAGNVDHKKLVSLVERACRKFRSSRMSYKRSQFPAQTHRSTVREYKKPITQAHVCLGTVGYSIRHKDRYTLLVLNALLGEGMSSRLYQTIREKHGLAYSVYSFLSFLSDTGVFGTYIGTDKNKVDDALALIRKEFSKLREKQVSRAELARTKSQIKGTMMLGLENMSSRMMRLGSGELQFETLVPIDAVLKKVDGVTAERIQVVANELLAESRFSTVILRPS
jgi:predicted Zn-dependent peptidase